MTSLTYITQQANKDLRMETEMAVLFESRNKTDSGACFSTCRTWRYALWRTWNDGPTAKYCAFIGLNPSTADETKDDPTIRRCINFAKAWGFAIEFTPGEGLE